MTKDISMTVFVADHDPSFLDLVKAQLSSKGMEVLTFNKGNDLITGLEEAAKTRNLPQVILLAALLPDRNGLELCKKIKEHRHFSACKVAIVSAIQRGTRVAHDARNQFKADEYLVQPLDLKNLHEILQKIAAGTTLVEAPAKTPEAPVRPEPKQEWKPEPVREPPPKAAPVREAAFTPEPPPAKVREPEAEKPRIVPRREEASESRKDWFEEIFDEELGDQDITERPIVGRKHAAPVRPSGERPLRIPSRGSLREVLFPELMLSLYQERSTGVLTILHNEEERRITFGNGIPVMVDSNYIAGQSLGSILLEQERITREQLTQAQREAKENKQRLGEVLVELGYIDGQELLATLHYQAEQKLLSAFRHGEGTFEFKAEALPANGPQLEESILGILLAGVKNFCTLVVLENRIYNNRHRIIGKSDVRQVKRAGLQLTTKEWAVLDLIDGKRTLGEIIGRAQLNFVRTFQVLYLFFLFGIIWFTDGDQGFFQLNEPVMNRALAEARAASPERAGFSARPEEGAEPEDGLVGLLYRLSGIHADGVVTVTTDDAVHKIVLSSGRPVKIAADHATSDSLGNRLVANGRITTWERDRALEEADSVSRPLGEILLSRGLITPHGLYEALVEQAEERLLSLSKFAASRDISYEAGKIDETPPPALDIDILKVLISALRSRIGIDKIKDDLSAHMNHYVNIPSSIQSRIQKNLADLRESHAVVQMNGKKRLEELLACVSLPRDQTLGLVYALFRLGLVEFLGD